jgi:voltage-dependent calcium channel
VPQLGIPDILVEDEDDDNDDDGEVRDQMGAGFPQQSRPSGLQLRTDHETLHERSGSNGSSLSPRDPSYQHPLSFPRSGEASPSHHHSSAAFSFEVQDPNQGQTGSPSRTDSQRASASSPARVEDMLDGSVWVESIRRSATIRRSDRGSLRYSDLG